MGEREREREEEGEGREESMEDVCVCACVHAKWLACVCVCIHACVVQREREREREREQRGHDFNCLRRLHLRRCLSDTRPIRCILSAGAGCLRIALLVKTLCRNCHGNRSPVLGAALAPSPFPHFLQCLATSRAISREESSRPAE